METAGVGHNSKPTRDEIEMAFRERTRSQRITENTPFDITWQWELVLSDLPANAKLIGFIVRLYAPGANEISRPSIDTICRLSGLSRQTVMTQLKALEKAFLLASEKGKGRAASSYNRVLPNRTVAEIATIIDFRSGQAIRPLDDRSGLTIRPQSDSVVVQPLDHNDRSGLIGDRSGLTIRPDLTIDLKEEREGSPVSIGKITAAFAAGVAAVVAPSVAAAEPHPVQQVYEAAAECWQNPRAQQAAALDVYELRAQKQVWITPSGALEITGAFKAEIEKAFPLVDMACGLAAACPNVKRDRRALDAMAAIRRQFGYMQQDAAAKKARAVQFDRKPTSSSKVDNLSEKPAGMPDKVWEGIQAAKAARQC